MLALDIIRNTALNCGKSVGPILVLSYKNHALDEFLCDVLRFSHMKTGMLIRTGKAESIELSSFSEKFSPQEQSAQEELARRVGTLRSARKAVIEWCSVSSALKFTPPEVTIAIDVCMLLLTYLCCLSFAELCSKFC